MFDIGADELLLTAIVAIVVIGPKDLPRALRVTGRWVAKMRRMSNAFRAGFESMVRDAEMEEMEREWKARNAAIMAAHPGGSADADAAAAAAAATYEHPVLNEPAQIEPAQIEPALIEPPAIAHQPLSAESPAMATSAPAVADSVADSASAAHSGGE